MCTNCVTNPDGTSIQITNIAVDGDYTITQDPLDNCKWTGTIPDGITFTNYDDGNCSSGASPSVQDMFITLFRTGPNTYVFLINDGDDNDAFGTNGITPTANRCDESFLNVANQQTSCSDNLDPAAINGTVDLVPCPSA